MHIRHQYLLYPLFLALCFFEPIGASTVVSIGGSNDTSYTLGTSADQVLVESWSSTNSYTGVSVSFVTNDLFSPPQLGVSGTAYLMSQIGSGTTVSDQIAKTSFTTNTAGISTISLFSGLTLGPGQYFLVLAGASSDRPWLTWEASNPQSGAVLTQGPGVTWTGDYFATSGVGSLDTSYIPASTFEFDGTGGRRPIFTLMSKPPECPNRI